MPTTTNLAAETENAAPLLLLPPKGITLNPLANPRNVKIDCEICSAPAHFACFQCRVTYYCTAAHLELDWKAIHAEICPMLQVLRAPSKIICYEEQKKTHELKMRKLQTKVLQIASTAAQKLLFEKAYDRAISAALAALFATIALHGDSDSDVQRKLVPCYLLLGEASVGLNDTIQAEAYLAAAEWALLKTAPQAPSQAPSHGRSKYAHLNVRGLEGARFGDARATAQEYLAAKHDATSPDGVAEKRMRSRLAQNLGILRIAQGGLDSALASLALSTLLATQIHGPDSYLVAGAYFRLGTVHDAMGRAPAAKACYMHVIYTWLCFFREGKDASELLDAAQVAEFHATFDHICKYLSEMKNSSPFALAAHAIFLRQLGLDESAKWQLAKKERESNERGDVLCLGHYDWAGLWVWIESQFELSGSTVLVE